MSSPATSIFSGSDIRAIHFGETEIISVTFDHGRQERNGFPEAFQQKKMAKRGIGTLSINISANNWFLSPELPALRDALQKHCAQARDIRAMAFSMGGFGCLMLSRALNMKRAMLFSPQYSIFPNKAPWDARRNRISRQYDEALDDLDQAIKPDLEGVILFDPRDRLDVMHARALTRIAPKMQLIALPFCGHPAHKFLLPKTEFWKYSYRLFKEDNPAVWFHKIRRKKREQTLQYLDGMSRYLDAREKEGPDGPPCDQDRSTRIRAVSGPKPIYGRRGPTAARS